MGKLRLCGKHVLGCVDSTSRVQVNGLFGTEVASILFTSPPYSDLRDYGGGLTLDPSHLAKLFDWPTKLFFINLGLIIRDRQIIPYWDDYLKEAKARNLKLLAWNIWDKGNASAPAHQQAMFGLCHEWVFAFGEYRPLSLTVENQSEAWGVATTRERDGRLTRRRHGKKVEVRSHRQLDSVIPLEPIKNYSAEYTGHPAAFPPSLPIEYIVASTNENDIVAEPFSGSGTTIIACERTKRRCFAAEIDPAYVDMSLNRYIKSFSKRVVNERGEEWVA